MGRWLTSFLFLLLHLTPTNSGCVPSSPLSRSAIIRNEKAKILQRIHLTRRPEPIDSPVFVRMERDLNDQNVPEYGVESSSFNPLSNSSICRAMDGDEVISDCFVFHIKSKGTISSADLVLLLRPQYRNFNISISVYEAARMDGQLSRIDRFVVPGSSSISEDLIIKTDIKDVIRQWFRGKIKNEVEKYLMISAKINGIELSYWDVFATTPSIDVTVGASELNMKQCNHSSKCCVMPFYLNFTELGWSDWILSPPGYLANYCVGHCSLNSETDTQTVLRTAKTNNTAFNLPRPTCAPLYYAPLKIIYTVGENDFRKSVLHGMTVLSCSCLSH